MPDKPSVLEATLRRFRIVQTEGSRQVSRAIDHYNLDAILQFNERNILTHAGAVSHQLAEQHAHAQFEQFDAERRRLEAAQPSSDFDQAVEEVKRLEAGDTPKSAPGAGRQAAKKAVRERKPKGNGE
jgi:hypothetical protein